MLASQKTMNLSISMFLLFVRRMTFLLDRQILLEEYLAVEECSPQLHQGKRKQLKLLQ